MSNLRVDILKDMQTQIFTDAGRSYSFRPKQKNDCTVRAAAIVFDLPYDVAYHYLAAAGRKCGKVFPFKQFMESKEVTDFYDILKQGFPAIKGQPRMNVEKFLKLHPNGSYVIKTAKQVIAVKEGMAYDDTPIDYKRCVYTSWTIINKGGRRL
jgi:hypothetical protein